MDGGPNSNGSAKLKHFQLYVYYFEYLMLWLSKSPMNLRNADDGPKLLLSSYY